MFQLDTALRPPRQVSGCTTSWPLPWCTIFTRAGRSAVGTAARPPLVSSRAKCFIETVSPARSRLRSNTVWARNSACGPLAVATLKRQGSMPFCQFENTKLTSGLPRQGPSGTTWRALTKKPGSPGHSPMSGSSGWRIAARPRSSVRPLHRRLPWQSCTATSAPATGLARSSVVTQARLFSRPSLKCTPRLVTSTPLRTYIGAGRSSRASPSRRDSISIRW